MTNKTTQINKTITLMMEINTQSEWVTPPKLKKKEERRTRTRNNKKKKEKTTNWSEMPRVPGQKMTSKNTWNTIQIHNTNTQYKYTIQIHNTNTQHTTHNTQHNTNTHFKHVDVTYFFSVVALPVTFLVGSGSEKSILVARGM